jgi:cyclic beta-1,2-glucan synthetase
VMAADVYGVDPHTGRGGWTWYTGSAGWMYRLMLESLLGLRRSGDTLQLQPCIPADWPGFSVDYRYGSSRFRIVVVQDAIPAPRLRVDGQSRPEPSFVMIDDGAVHRVELDWPRGPVQQPVRD